jgi:hypothetical protein
VALKRRLLVEFTNSLPPASAIIIHEAFDEVHEEFLKGPDKQEARRVGHRSRDPRWDALYSDPLIIAACQWGGAVRMLKLAEQGQRNSENDLLPTVSLVDTLEARSFRLLRKALQDYWTRVAAGLEPTSALHSIETLALTVSLTLMIWTSDKLLNKPAVVRSLLKQLEAVWKHCRIPGENGRPVDISLLDDFLLVQISISCFWLVNATDLIIAAATSTPEIFDLVADFPSVPAGSPLIPLLSLEPPSRREMNGPTPPKLLSRFMTFTCSDLLGWLDPLFPLQPGWESTRDLVLERTVTGVAESGFGLFLFLVLYLGARTSDYIRLLRDVAGFRVLDVLMFEETIGADRATALDKVSMSYLDWLPGNQHMPEAIRRRRFFEDAITRIEGALPPKMAEAARKGEISGLSPPLVPALMAMRQLIMLTNMPEPFQDLYAEAPKDDSSDDDEDAPSPLMRVYFQSDCFAKAVGAGNVITKTLRGALDLWPVTMLRREHFGAQLGACAIYACWLHLLVLQRLRWLLGYVSETDRAGALDLYNNIHADIATCLEFLEVVGKPDLLSARTMLQSVLDGSRTAFTKAEVQMLKLVRGMTPRRCRHGNTHAGGGTCFLCIVDQQRRTSERDNDVDSVLDPGSEDDQMVRAFHSLGLVENSGSSTVLPDAFLTRAASDHSYFLQQPNDARTTEGNRMALKSALSHSKAPGRKPRLRVSFSDEVTVRETYSREEYPGRSLVASDGSGDKGQALQARMEAEERSRQLGLMMRRGASLKEMPNLKKELVVLPQKCIMKQD